MSAAGPVDDPLERHHACYRPGEVAAEPDGRLHSPTFLRNNPPIIAALAPWLAGRVGMALEIGSGTGQQAAAFALAFLDLEWWPSEPDEIHRASIAAWWRALGLPEREPLALDAATDWAARDDVKALGPLSVVISLNVIHITPFAVARGIVSGAGKALVAGGLLIFYGPFREFGEHTGAGNEAFDARLRAENPEWGVRDTREIIDLADVAGLEFAAFIRMPANNRILIFRRP